MITQERLKELLDYDPKSGVFVWKVSKSKNIKIGQKAGSFEKNGYLRIRIDRKGHLAHRLAWLYSYGEFPDGFIDHINRNPSDNALSNLRVLSNSDNMHNCDPHKNNKSGHVGVYWCKQSKKWRAGIKKNYLHIHLGSFDSIDEAVNARKEGEKKYFKGVRIYD